MAGRVFDASFLIKLLDPKVKGEGDIDARLAHLIETLDRQKDDIIVPTPALSEVLIGAGDGAPAYLDILSRSSRFKVAPFGTRAAVEAAARHRDAIKAGDKKEGSPSWAKVKYDRQIIAIAKVEGADSIYSQDGDVLRIGKAEGFKVYRLEDLDAPPPKTPDLFDDR